MTAFAAAPPLPPGLTFDPDFLAPAAADALLAALLAPGAVAWAQHHIRLFGRLVPEPRHTAWVGEAGATYAYSGVRREPAPWPVALSAVRAALELATGARYNSALLNLYRDGRDSMGWHADDEPELGPAPVIASVSLGAARRFRFRRRLAHADTRSLLLTPGSLLLMHGDLQTHWQHAIPKTARPVGARLNLTFRWVEPPPVPGR